MAYDFISDKRTPKVDPYDPKSPTGKAAAAMNKRAKKGFNKVLDVMPGGSYPKNNPSEVASSYKDAGGGWKGVGAGAGALARQTLGQGKAMLTDALEYGRDASLGAANELVGKPVRNVTGALSDVGTGLWQGLTGSKPKISPPSVSAAPVKPAPRPVISADQTRNRVGRQSAPAGEVSMPTSQRMPAPTPQRPPAVTPPMARTQPAQQEQPLRYTRNGISVTPRDIPGSAYADADPRDQKRFREGFDQSNGKVVGKRTGPGSPGYIPPHSRGGERKGPKTIGEMIMARGRMNLEKDRAGINSDRVKNRQAAINSARDFQTSSDRNSLYGRNIDETNRRFGETMAFDREKFTAGEERENTLTDARLRELELSTGASDLKLSTARQIRALQSQAMDRNLSEEKRAQAVEDLGVLEGKEPTQYKSATREVMGEDNMPRKELIYYDPQNPADTGPLGPQPEPLPAPKEASARKVGQKYRTADGRLVTWDGKGFLLAE